MGKYEPLARYLKNLSTERWDARFKQIEDILDFELPKSARVYDSWWGNSRRGNHSQAKGWISAGWQVSHVDRPNEKVTLEKSRHSGARGVDQELVELWQKACEISGIPNANEVQKIAATQFIQREAARQLALMGGTMPDAEAPPRRRFP